MLVVAIVWIRKAPEKGLLVIFERLDAESKKRWLFDPVCWIVKLEELIRHGRNKDLVYQRRKGKASGQRCCCLEIETGDLGKKGKKRVYEKRNGRNGRKEREKRQEKQRGGRVKLILPGESMCENPVCVGGKGNVGSSCEWARHLWTVCLADSWWMGTLWYLRPAA